MDVKDRRDAVSLLAGVWLAVSPGLLEYDADRLATLHAMIAGGLIIFTAVHALYRVSAWPHWLNLGLGLWLAASPWALGFAAMQTVTLNAVLVGALLAGLALWAIGAARRGAAGPRPPS